MTTRTIRRLALAALLACVSVAALAQAETLMPLAGLRAGALPDGFTAARTGRGAPAAWAVVADPAAEGGLALAQTGADPTDYRYPLGIVAGPPAANVDVTVRSSRSAGGPTRPAASPSGSPTPTTTSWCAPTRWKTT